MRVHGGLKREDWEHWGQFTTFKENAAALLAKELRPDMAIYCSPLTDPYQPAEAEVRMMPVLLEAVHARPPRRFVIQTRGTLVLRDIELLRHPSIRVSFSITTDDDTIRRRFEPHCAPVAERVAALSALSAAGIAAFATLAPLLPCDPEALTSLAVRATPNALVGDPLHVRAVKPGGATTRPGAFRILDHHRQSEYADPAWQAGLIERLRAAAARHGRRFGVGPEAFGWLAE